MGHSKLDHTKVIDVYIKEIETIGFGHKRYSSEKKKLSTWHMTYIADCLERQLIVHTLKEERYGL